MFDLIERGHNSAVTSTVTLLELLVQPYPDQKEELAQKIFALAGTYPQIEWAPVTLNLADRAAELRALSSQHAGCHSGRHGYQPQSDVFFRE